MSGFSLDGHTLRLAGGRPGSEDVRFEFHEDEGVVWVKYRGGPLGAGVLVAHRDGADLQIRYPQQRDGGARERGWSLNRVERRDDGGVRVREEVAFDSRASDSPATLEEIGS
jgi:hypothetical protein